MVAVAQVMQCVFLAVLTFSSSAKRMLDTKQTSVYNVKSPMGTVCPSLRFHSLQPEGTIRSPDRTACSSQDR